MLRAGFDPTIQVFKQAKTVHDLDRAATLIKYLNTGLKLYSLCQFARFLFYPKSFSYLTNINVF
jgi:hypothetical protein